MSVQSIEEAMQRSGTQKVSGIVLAGGQGRRMGGVDKGLQVLRGKPMVFWAIERLIPQVDQILINANQNTNAYARLGYRVVADSIEGFAGPLAGLQAGMQVATHELVLTVPCDSPFLPLDLVSRLRGALGDNDLAVAKTGTQPHPVFALTRRGLLDHLTAYLEGGGRKIDAWYAALKVVEVPFDDQVEAFSNINTREELRAHDLSAPDAARNPDLSAPDAARNPDLSAPDAARNPT